MKQKQKITIYWKTRNSTLIDNIRKEFSISQGMTVNGENDVIADGEGMRKLREYEAQGFIELRRKWNDGHEKTQA